MLKFIILLVRSNPEPNKGVRRKKVTRGAIMLADADGPDVSFQLFEMKRGMKRISKPNQKRSAGQLLNLLWERVESPPVSGVNL
jgi:hypothetical protein